MHTDSFSHIAHGNPPPKSALPPWQQFFALPAYYWLLVACFWVMVIHSPHIPIWLSVFGLVSIIAQLPTLKSKFKKQKSLYKGIQLFGFLLGVIGLWLSFGQILVTDVSICFLALCLFAKLWEIYNKRDAYVVLNLCLFVIASGFLWSQNFGMAVGAMVAMAMVLLGFIALADDNNTTGAGRLRALGFVMLPALPLLVILFLFFPRFDPLWTLNLAGNKATTGVSDSMSPGDFANLSKSTQLAFRVEFQGKIPSRHELYWRGLIFEQFDGITWRESPRPRSYWRSLEEPPKWANPILGTAKDSYTIMLEPTQQHWLFGLDYSRLSPLRGVGTADDFTLRSYHPITQRFRYQAGYYPDAQVGIALSTPEKQATLQLPKTGNDKSRQLAQELFHQAQGDTVQFVNLFQNHISRNDFYYTLSPPALNKERIDEFLFGTRQGFCEHYASSFVFLARSAGIPARVVAGYQGGQLGRDGKSWEVRQMDAHAWAEVWVEGQGWVRVDPTAFVAPNRILDGMSDYTEEMGSVAFGEGVAGTLGYQQFRLLQSIYRFSDELSYHWQKSIVGFDGENQKNTLSKLGIGSLMEQIALMMASFAFVLTCLGIVFWYRRRVIYHVFDKPVHMLAKRLAKQNPAFTKTSSESHLSYLIRMQQHTDEATAKQLDELSKTYRMYRFGKLAEEEGMPHYQHTAKNFGKTLSTLAKHIKITKP